MGKKVIVNNSRVLKDIETGEVFVQCGCGGELTPIGGGDGDGDGDGDGCGAFVVNYTSYWSDGSYTMDKTVDEIMDAFMNNRVILIYAKSNDGGEEWLDYVYQVVYATENGEYQQGDEWLLEKRIYCLGFDSNNCIVHLTIGEKTGIKQQYETFISSGNIVLTGNVGFNMQSKTPGSKKIFNITVDDDGVLSARETGILLPTFTVNGEEEEGPPPA